MATNNLSLLRKGRPFIMRGAYVATFLSRCMRLWRETIFRCQSYSTTTDEKVQLPFPLPFLDTWRLALPLTSACPR